MKFLLTALLLGSSVAAFASTGSLSAVQGNVIVSSGSSTFKAAPGAVLKDGDLITVSAGASALIQVGKCSVALTSGKSLVVNSALPCVELSASVKSLAMPKSVVAADNDDRGFIAAFPGGAVGLGLAVVGGGLLIKKIVDDNKTTTTTSAPAPVVVPPKASKA